MAGWTFENALAAIQSPSSIPFSVLLSMDGLRLGDIHYAKIQTTLRMRTVSITVLERWIANGSFNPECMTEGNYSRSTTILIILNPNKQGTALKCVSVRLIVRRCMGPVGQINDIMKLIMHAHSLLAGWQSSDNACRTFCIIVGDYSGHMALPQTHCSAQLILYPQGWSRTDDFQESTESSCLLHCRCFNGLPITRMRLSSTWIREGQMMQAPRYSQGSTFFAQPLSPDHGSSWSCSIICTPVRRGSSLFHRWTIREYGHTIPWHNRGFRYVYGWGDRHPDRCGSSQIHDRQYIHYSIAITHLQDGAQLVYQGTRPQGFSKPQASSNCGRWKLWRLGQVRTWTWGGMQTTSLTDRHQTQSYQKQWLNPWVHNRRWVRRHTQMWQIRWHGCFRWASLPKGVTGWEREVSWM